jgi:hypothetical protein
VKSNNKNFRKESINRTYLSQNDIFLKERPTEEGGSGSSSSGPFTAPEDHTAPTSPASPEPRGACAADAAPLFTPSSSSSLSPRHGGSLGSESHPSATYAFWLDAGRNRNTK